MYLWTDQWWLDLRNLSKVQKCLKIDAERCSYLSACCIQVEPLKFGNWWQKRLLEAWLKFVALNIFPRGTINTVWTLTLLSDFCSFQTVHIHGHSSYLPWHSHFPLCHLKRAIIQYKNDYHSYFCSRDMGVWLLISYSSQTMKLMVRRRCLRLG